ncbi:hypothetical protein JTB14_009700 [Gonioctena quinquepunctata]|nr:hypothetical protein JTB14_009700 [Gonioctena quinquepunctata]
MPDSPIFSKEAGKNKIKRQKVNVKSRPQKIGNSSTYINVPKNKPRTKKPIATDYTEVKNEVSIEWNTTGILPKHLKENAVSDDVSKSGDTEEKENVINPEIEKVNNESLK